MSPPSTSISPSWISGPGNEGKPGFDLPTPSDRFSPAMQWAGFAQGDPIDRTDAGVAQSHAVEASTTWPLPVIAAR